METVIKLFEEKKIVLIETKLPENGIFRLLMWLKF